MPTQRPHLIALEQADIDAAHAAAGNLYHEYLRVPALSMGLYVLPADGIDPQQPHGEDEVYYVLSGRAVIQVEGDEIPVQPGSTIYVAAGADHRFHSIEDELRMLVFFAPAEGA